MTHLTFPNESADHCVATLPHLRHQPPSRQGRGNVAGTLTSPAHHFDLTVPTVRSPHCRGCPTPFACGLRFQNSI
jgi:hypothetical protein